MKILQFLAAAKTEFSSKPAASFYGQPKQNAPTPSPTKSKSNFGNTTMNDVTAVPIRDITPYNSTSP